MNPLRFSVTPLAALAMLIPFAAFADSAEGVVIPGIAGTETIAGVRDLIPINGFSGGAPGYPLVLYRQIDSTSPLFFQAVVTGEHFGPATFYDFSSVGAAPLKVAYEYDVTGLIAESYKSFGRNEQVGFDFSTLTVVSPPGNPGNPVSAPELDVSSAASEITLLMAGVVILCARRRRHDKSGQVALA